MFRENEWSVFVPLYGSCICTIVPVVPFEPFVVGLFGGIGWWLVLIVYCILCFVFCILYFAFCSAFFLGLAWCIIVRACLVCLVVAAWVKCKCGVVVALEEAVVVNCPSYSMFSFHYDFLEEA